jgi:hypothetical protein
MQLLAAPLILTCGPAVLSTFALVRTLKVYKSGQLRTFPLWAVGVAWLITAYAAFIFLRYTVKPLPFLPPWKDPETLDLAMLFFLAPIGLASAVVAGLGGASKWVVVSLVVGLLVLFFVGLLEGASV